MKTSVSPHMVVLLALSSIASLSAQNSICTTRSLESSSKADFVDGISEPGFSEVSVLPDRYELPASAKAHGVLPEGKPVYAAQDVRTLESQISNPRSVESVVDLGVLRNPSPYRKVAVSAAGQPYEISGDGLQEGLAMISAAYRESGKHQQTADCLSVSLSVEQKTKLDLGKVLEIVDAEVRANPTCACEIVKAAIKASEADVQLVVGITETAIMAAPESMRMVSQCAIASVPESIAEVQALLARIEPNSGDTRIYSSKGSAKNVYLATDSKDAKSAKGTKVASLVAPVVPNPLDRPYLPPLMPPLIYPQRVSEVNPAPFVPHDPDCPYD